jgi:hypothetical protein
VAAQEPGAGRRGEFPEGAIGVVRPAQMALGIGDHDLDPGRRILEDRRAQEAAGGLEHRQRSAQAGGEIGGGAGDRGQVRGGHA